MTTVAWPPEVRAAASPETYGRVAGCTGSAIEVEGLPAAVGDAVTVLRSGAPLVCEVVALRRELVVCLPLGDGTGVRSGDWVGHLGGPLRVPVGPGLLGRVVDGLGRPLPGSPPLGRDTVEVPLGADPPDALGRPLVSERLALGVRVVDGLVPVGRGQRLGILAGSGVGKSSLLSMVTRYTDADVVVLALIGERGREVGEFLERDLGADGRRRAVTVVSTSDQPALVRLRAAFLATRVAESFRDDGAHVLLLMDSLTRFAMAQREVGLAAGEPPVTRGYPPSVFGLLPRLLERAGTSANGSITGLYTVLVDGDDMNEPVTDAVRSILDGHVVLSRRLAESGHFPAVDVCASLSRVAGAVSSPEERAAQTRVRALLAALGEARDLLEVGAYVAGSDPVLDEALRRAPVIEAFCRQEMHERSSLVDTLQALEGLVAG